MLAAARFRDAELEAQYQQERAEQLVRKDMRAAVAFTLLWAWDCFRFLGIDLLALLKATAWLAAVGLKPVYVHRIVGKEFYREYRVWITSFTKIVFAMHPPGETLHLAALGRKAAPATLGAALWALAEGLRLPYLWVTGLGWTDLVQNFPVQLALVGRAMKDNQAQCSAPYLSPAAQSLLRGAADRVTSALSMLLLLGSGRAGAGYKASFPIALDPCTVLGGWAAFCLGFLLPALVVLASERRARARFAAAHAQRLSSAERRHWEEAGVSPATWAALLAALAYACLLLWQVALSAFLWRQEQGQEGAAAPGCGMPAAAGAVTGGGSVLGGASEGVVP